MPDSLKNVTGYYGLATYFPGLKTLLRLDGPPPTDIWLDSRLKVAAIDCSGTPGPCRIDVGGTSIRAYMKVTHCLDPIRWIQGDYYLAGHPVLPTTRRLRRTSKKLADPWNQAYIDAVGCYILGRLKEGGASPHFNSFYGAFKATAATYSYNLTDDFDSYRHHRWFWQSKQKGYYELGVVNEDDPSEPVPAKVLNDIMMQQGSGSDSESDDSSFGSSGSEASESESGSDSGSDASEASEESDKSSEPETIDVQLEAIPDTNSVHTDNMSNLSFASSDMDDSEYKILCNIKDFPVMMIITEESQGTMDALLEDYDAVGSSPGSPEWEECWSAWIFQIIAGLSVAQDLIGFTHNDLHTNNIVWTATEEDFLYYTKRDGTHFKVPTFGKVFRIIDFGRSIFRFNGRLFVSDDFRTENDAGGQYRFAPLNKSTRNPVMPNPSFDLCRLSVSLFNSLFPDPLEDLDGGAVLSSEEGLVVKEKISPLYNILWTWMIDDAGENVFINPDGSERFPDFYLYKHIAAKIHRAVPALQFSKPAFDRFQVNPSSVGDVKKWSLYC